MAKKLNRRNFLKKSIIASGAVVGLSSFEEKALLAHQAMAAENPGFDEKKDEPVKGLLRGNIGNIEISRVIIGSNLFYSGAHDMRVLMECKQAGVECDYFFKTIHPDTYWGTLREEEKRPYLVDSFGPDDYDCMWEQWPEKSIKVMNDIKTPWIGFKVLAAGAVHPKEGFKFAFQNGADFVCAGMFDWQVRENARIAKDILSEKSVKNRKRAWIA